MAHRSKKQAKLRRADPSGPQREDSVDAELKQGANIALYAMAEIALLAVLKAGVGFMTGIVVLMADALASFSDMLGVFASYFGLKMSRRRADEKFKYGYYKAESFAAFLASLLIIYLGFEVLKESGERLFVVEETHDHLLAMGQVAVTILISLHLAHYLIRTGKRINSLSLVNSGKEKRSDLIAQIAVVAGIAAGFFRIPYLEGIIGIILSVIILKVGFESGKESLFFLLDYFDDQEFVKKVRKTILSKSKIVRKVLNIRMRRAGTFIFGEAFLEIDPYVETKDIRNDLNILKEKISKTNKHLKDFSLFVEIPQINRIRVAVPVKNDAGLKSEIATTLEETRHYIFVDVADGKITDYYGKVFPFRTFDFIGITRFLKEEEAKVVINNNMHSLLFYNLRRLQHILVYPHFNNIKDVENTIKLLLIDT